MAKDQETIEEMMKRLGCNTNFISQKHITDRIKRVEHKKIEGCGHLFMYCFIEMDNGFVVTGKPATCIDPANWRDEIGQKVSFDNTFSEIFRLEAYRSMSDNTVDIMRIARKCHEANKAYCETLGDYSQLPWDEAPIWQKQTVIKGVEFRLANPNATSADMHNSWMKEKLAEGWVYGEKKDEVYRTHPCLVPYDELPSAQRMKDFLFSKVVDLEVNHG